MRRLQGFVLIVVILLSIAGGALACASSQPPAATIDIDAVREYADTRTETILQGLSEHDIEKYTQYFTEEAKTATTQELFNITVKQLESLLGIYVSKDFWYIEQQEGYIVVRYLTSYTRGQVVARMVFDKDHLIAGHWFE
ncbi:DUF3887 domain-containing protein [Chloroflexota bacterium]